MTDSFEASTSYLTRRTIAPAAPLVDLLLPIGVAFIVIFGVVQILKIPSFSSNKLAEPANLKVVVGGVDEANHQKFSTIKNTAKCVESIANYPSIGQPQIDSYLKSEAERIYANFLETTSKSRQCNSEQKINYTVFPISDRFISVILYEARTISNSSSIKLHPYTFDRTTGEIIKLSRVFRDSSILSSYENPDLLLESNFGVDKANRELILAGEQRIAFENLSKYIAIDIAEEMFGISPFAYKDPDNINCSVEKCLALTFDDGPGPYTGQLLDILRYSNAKATFFVLGNRVAGYADTVSRIASEGHDVGSHSWRHANLPTLSLPQISGDLGTTAQTIQNITHERVRFFRPPYGSVNDSVRQVASNLEEEIIMWGIDPRDWQSKNAAQICSHIVGNVSPGVVILLHDIYSTSVEAAQCVINQLSYEYTFVNLTTLYK